MPSLRYRIAVIVAIVACLSFAVRRYQLDDALIYAVYVRNALAGHGFVFNIGESVNALTSPFFAALLFLVSWLLHGHILLAELLLSAAFFAAACVLAEFMAPLAGLLLSSLAFFYLCFGMETSVSLFMLMVLLTLYLRRRFLWLPTVALLTVLTRFESGALVLVIAIAMVKQRRWPPLRAYIAPVLLSILYLAFNFGLYHHVLPGSLLAKFQQGTSQLWGPWPKAFMRMPYQITTSFANWFYLLPVVVVLIVLAYRKLRGMVMQVLLPQFLVILLLFYLLFNIPNYHWYDAPFVFFGLLYAMLGLPKSKAATALVCVAVAALVSTGYFYLRQQQQGWHQEYGQVADWIVTQGNPGVRVAAVETGTLAWECHCQVEDILGITDLANGKLLARGDVQSWILRSPPDFVVMHKPPIFGEVAAANSPDYQKVAFDAGHIYLLARQRDQGKAESPR